MLLFFLFAPFLLLFGKRAAPGVCTVVVVAAAAAAAVVTPGPAALSLRRDIDDDHCVSSISPVSLYGE